MDDESCTSFYVLLICKMNLEITIVATWQIMLLIQAFSTLVSVILDLQKVYKLQFCRLTHPFTKFTLHKPSLLLDLLLNLRSNDGDSRP